MPDLTISIASYNTAELTKKCVQSVIEHTKGISYQLIVVDNASTDNTVELLSPLLKKIVLVQAAHNLGFGKAHNLALKGATGKYFAVLNSDCWITDDVFSALVMHLESRSYCGLVAPVIKNAAGIFQESAGEFTGLLYPFTGKVGRGYTHWVGGQCFATRRYFQAKGPLKREWKFEFDERYFMYFEDEDVCNTIAELGYEVHYIWGSVFHVGNASVNPKKQEYFVDSMRAYYRKWHGPLANILLEVSIIARFVASVYKYAAPLAIIGLGLVVGTYYISDGDGLTRICGFIAEVLCSIAVFMVMMRLGRSGNG